jgi:hypothetical protein
VTGNTLHQQGECIAGEIVKSALPPPTSVEVLEQDGAFYLLRLDSEGQCITDTWHETPESAKAQANFEYGIEENDWKRVDAAPGLESASRRMG